MNLQSYFFLLLSLILFSTSCKPKGQVHFEKTSISIEGTESYCGGARPSDELLKKLESKHPIEERAFYLVSMEDQSRVKVMTDTSGKIMIDGLKEGSYNGFLAEKVDFDGPGFDPKTCKKWQATPDFSFTLSDEAIMITCHIGCNECLPPSP